MNHIMFRFKMNTREVQKVSGEVVEVSSMDVIPTATVYNSAREITNELSNFTDNTIKNREKKYKEFINCCKKTVVNSTTDFIMLNARLGGIGKYFYDNGEWMIDYLKRDGFTINNTDECIWTLKWPCEPLENANDARKLSFKILYEKIKVKVREASKRGEISVAINLKFNIEFQNYLNTKGYRVDIGNDNYMKTISW